MRTLAVWANGDLQDPGVPTVNATDPAFTVGHGLFETLRVEDSAALARDLHLQRLLSSAAELGITADPTQINAGIDAVLPQAPSRARLRYTVSGGGGVVVTLAELVPTPPTVRAITTPWPRNEHSPLTRHKTTAWYECALALRQAQEQGADEALFCNTAGDYCEGTTSNLFIVVDGTLLTPPVTAGLLPGVTRALLMEHAAAQGIPVQESPISPSLLIRADEVLLTSSLKDVVPVTELDGRTLPIGPLAQLLMSTFRQPR